MAGWGPYMAHLHRTFAAVIHKLLILNGEGNMSKYEWGLLPFLATVFIYIKRLYKFFMFFCYSTRPQPMNHSQTRRGKKNMGKRKINKTPRKVRDRGASSRALKKHPPPPCSGLSEEEYPTIPKITIYFQLKLLLSLTRFNQLHIERNTTCRMTAKCYPNCWRCLQRVINMWMK